MTEDDVGVGCYLNAYDRETMEDEAKMELQRTSRIRPGFGSTRVQHPEQLSYGKNTPGPGAYRYQGQPLTVTQCLLRELPTCALPTCVPSTASSHYSTACAPTLCACVLPTQARMSPSTRRCT